MAQFQIYNYRFGRIEKTRQANEFVWRTERMDASPRVVSHTSRLVPKDKPSFGGTIIVNISHLYLIFVKSNQ